VTREVVAMLAVERDQNLAVTVPVVVVVALAVVEADDVPIDKGLRRQLAGDVQEVMSEAEAVEKNRRRMVGSALLNEEVVRILPL